MNDEVYIRLRAALAEKYREQWEIVAHKDDPAYGYPGTYSRLNEVSYGVGAIIHVGQLVLDPQDAERLDDDAKSLAREE